MDDAYEPERKALAQKQAVNEALERAARVCLDISKQLDPDLHKLPRAIVGRCITAILALKT